MTKTKDTVDLEVPGTSSRLRCHLAEPSTPGPHAAVLVAHELFGVNEDIRGVLDQLADLGYVALAPEFYHRHADPGAVFPRDDEGRAAGFEQLGHVTRATAMADVEAALAHLRSRPDTTGRTAMLGFSFGGHLAYLAATRFDLAVTIVLYGGWITTTDIPLSQPAATVTLTPGIAARGGRLAYLVGEDDRLITAEQVATLERALTDAGVRHEVVTFPHTDHAFFWEGTDAFDADARDAAWAEIRTLLAESL